MSFGQGSLRKTMYVAYFPREKKLYAALDEEFLAALGLRITGGWVYVT